MSREDADVTLVFLSGEGVAHTAPSNDDWYRISPTRVNDNPEHNITLSPAGIFLPLEPASPLACAEQYQFCYRDTQHCGILGSLLDARSSLADIIKSTTASQHSTLGNHDSFTYFIKAGFSSYQSGRIGKLIGQLGPSSLASRDSLATAIQGPLPSNQWQLDVIRWFDISKALLQAAYLEISYFNPSDQSLLPFRTNFTSPGLQKLCKNQVSEPLPKYLPQPLGC